MSRVLILCLRLAEAACPLCELYDFAQYERQAEKSGDKNQNYKRTRHDTTYPTLALRLCAAGLPNTDMCCGCDGVSLDARLHDSQPT
jgi:hypothetical protein